MLRSPIDVGRQTGDPFNRKGRNMATTRTRTRTKAAVITGPHPRGGWQNKIADSTRAAHVHPTKEAAEAKGRSMARSRKVEHIIQDQNGRIQERNSYGNDPAGRAG